MKTQSDPSFDLSSVFEVEDYLYFYAEDLTDERTDAEVNQLVSLLELNSTHRVLDLACGYGRHTNRLAALGYHVVGVDLMPGFLDIARTQAANLGLHVAYQEGDMRHLSYVNAFDRVVLFFTGFGYFSDEENVQVLRNIAKALKPGGLAVFDIPNRDVIAGEAQSSAVVEKNGDLMINRLSFEVETARFHNRRIVIRDNVRKDKPFSIRLYNLQEIKALLKEAGLDVHNIVGDDGKPLSAQSRRLIVVARKPGEN